VASPLRTRNGAPFRIADNPMMAASPVVPPEQVTSAFPRIGQSASVSLDLIRASAAEAVVVGHAISFFGVFPSLQPPHAPYMQNVGVLVFFLLSGYLISHTLWRKRQNRGYGFRIYLIERFARIYSGLLPGLLFILIIDAAAILTTSKYQYSNTFALGTLAANVLMLQDHHLVIWVSKTFPWAVSTDLATRLDAFGSGRPLWTLAIEWWIYLLVGALVLVVPHRRLSRGASACLVLFAAVPVYNLVGGRGNGLTLVWLLGAVVFWFSKDPSFVRLRAGTALMAAGAFTVLAFVRVRLTGSEYDLVFAALLGIALYFLLIACDRSHFRYPDTAARVIRFAAGYSLTLYITHYTLLAAVIAFDLPLPRMVIAVGSFALCNTVAALLASPTELRHRALALWLQRRFHVGASARIDLNPMHESAASK
jgi:peptidoglycan/LPS O-acetylase OafA/YrhL